MIFRDGFWWPDQDVHCHQVIPNQVKDIEIALRYVQDPRVCIQAGGNVGIWPKYLSNIFEYTFTFEPDKENFECLEKNLDGITNIAYYNKALGNENSKGRLVGKKDNCGAYQVEEGEDFEITTIDSMDVVPDLIYLDIEGFEYFAIQGGINTIQNFRPVIAVEDKGLSEKYGIKKGAVEELLTPLGYEIVERVHRDVVFAPGP